MVEIVPFKDEYLDDIYEIEVESFTIPWSKRDIHHDAMENNLAVYVVAICDGVVAGYAGMWHVVNEGHVTNIAVKNEYRHRGIGQQLMNKIESIAMQREMIGITLEVRMNNDAAQRLYLKNGYKVEGIRKNYYADTKEDALIMWKYFENYERFESV